MNEQIKKLEFKDWLYLFVSNLDEVFNKLAELGLVRENEFPHLAMLYLTDMFWGSEVWLATENCQTQEEYNAVIKQLSKQQVEDDITSVLLDKKMDKKNIETVIKELNFDFFIY